MEKAIVFDLKKEFNNITHFNNICRKQKKLRREVYVYTDYKFRNCFPDADYVFTIHSNYTSNDLHNERIRILAEKKADIETIKRKLKSYIPIEDYSSFKGNIVNQYKISFSTTRDEFRDKGDNFNWCKSTKEAYDKYAELPPYVVINGRNTNKTNGTDFYNRDFWMVIKHLVDNGIPVINTTIAPYGYDFGPLYQEIDCTDDYNEMTAIFQAANCVLHISDSAGINQNFTIKCNMVMLSNGTAFADNDDFGDIYSARKENCSSIVTDKIYYKKGDKAGWDIAPALEEILKLAQNDRPEITEFFDEQTIIQL